MGQGPLDDRIKRLVEARLDLYEAIGPIAVMARALAVDSSRLARTLDQTRSMQAGLVRAHFAPELGSLTPARGDDLVLLIDSMTSFEAWDLLRTTHRRPPADPASVARRAEGAVRVSGSGGGRVRELDRELRRPPRGGCVEEPRGRP